MNINADNLSIVLWIVLFMGLLFISSSNYGQKQNAEWSEPSLFYDFPDTSEVRDFQIDVYKKIISTVVWHRRQINGRFLDFSEIFFLQRKMNGELELRQLSSANFPAEQPVISRDQSHKLHFLWGDRRQDPQFEEWDTERPQSLGFSTSVIYAQLDGDVFQSPRAIYEGHLSTFGIGDIGFPLRIVVDEEGRLHTVFKADSMLTTTTSEGEDTVGFRPYITYMNQNLTGEWSSARFLQPGNEPDIASLPEGRLVSAWLGSDPNQSSINDVLIITSDNNGLSWSDPELIFLSGKQPGRMLRLLAGPDGRLHLIWGRQTTGLPVPHEIWHSYSEDEGNTWSSPERFFELDDISEVENFIGNFEIVIDRFGRVHWAAVEVRLLQGDGADSFVHITEWNPLTKSWRKVNTLDFANEPRQVRLSLDGSLDQLYIFWVERFEKKFYYSIKELESPILPPIVAVSGPLQLHPNYPNPFNTSTVIPFTLEEGGDVELTVYDITGRELLSKDLGTISPGFHQQGVTLNEMASGLYIYEIVLNGTYRQQHTMVVLK